MHGITRLDSKEVRFEKGKQRFRMRWRYSAETFRTTIYTTNHPSIHLLDTLCSAWNLCPPALSLEASLREALLDMVTSRFRVFLDASLLISLPLPLPKRCRQSPHNRQHKRLFAVAIDTQQQPPYQKRDNSPALSTIVNIAAKTAKLGTTKRSMMSIIWREESCLGSLLSESETFRGLRNDCLTLTL